MRDARCEISRNFLQLVSFLIKFVQAMQSQRPAGGWNIDGKNVGIPEICPDRGFGFVILKIECYLIVHCADSKPFYMGRIQLPSQMFVMSLWHASHMWNYVRSIWLFSFSNHKKVNWCSKFVLWRVSYKFPHSCASCSSSIIPLLAELGICGLRIRSVVQKVTSRPISI